MKKIVIIILAVVTIGIFISSCKSSESCPAYGEAKKFQIEQRY
jgi:hypothetical protein